MRMFLLTSRVDEPAVGGATVRVGRRWIRRFARATDPGLETGATGRPQEVQLGHVQ